MSDDTGLADGGGGPQRIEGWLMTWGRSTFFHYLKSSLKLKRFSDSRLYM